MNRPPDDPGAPLDTFIAGLAADEATVCARIIAVALEVAPDAVQGTSYGVPALRLRGKPLLGMQRAKRHLSLYPFSPSALDTVRADLGDWECAKGTIRFTPERPLPDGVLTRLIRARTREIDPDGAFSPKTTTIDES